MNGRSDYDFRTDSWILRDRFSPFDAGGRSELPAPPLPPSSSWYPSVVASVPKRPRRAWLVRAGGIGLASLTWIAIFRGRTIEFLGWEMLLFSLLSVGCAYAEAHQVATSERDLLLLENPDDESVCLVEVKVWAGIHHLGTDRAAAWFQDGCLMVAGHRCSFSIGGEDVVPKRERRRFAHTDNLVRGEETIVPLRHPKEAVWITLAPLLTGAIPSKRGWDFIRRLTDFRDRPVASRGPRQYPPLSPMPQERHRD